MLTKLLKNQSTFDENGSLLATVEFEYDEFNNKTKETFTNSSGKKTITTYSYTYDNFGNITEEIENSTLNGISIRKLEYF